MSLVAVVISAVVLTFIVLNIIKDSVNGWGIPLLYGIIIGSLILAIVVKTVAGTLFFITVSITTLFIGYYWFVKVFIK